MKFYRKAIIRSIVCIICILAAAGVFQREAAAQVADDFEDGFPGGYSADWSGDWNTITSGTISVVSYTPHVSISPSNWLQFSDTGDADRAVDLSSAGAATLTFDYDETFHSTFYVYVSTDGGTNWDPTPVATITTEGSGPCTDAGQYGQCSIDLSSYMPAPNFAIRFSSTGGSGEEVYIDNVQISIVVLAISLIVDDKYSEDQTVSVTVRRNGPTTTSAVTVDLSSSDTNIAEFAAASVSIGIGASETTVNLTLKDISGIQSVTLTATDQATPDVYLGDTEEIKVLDDDYTGNYGSSEGSSIGLSTFLMVASYDWLHNFYDDNEYADGTTTDLDTDNFNKIIMVDSNLFPVYTALKGDQEWPNVVMRNWTSGPGTGSPTSPSVNDYMNRSLAVVANYINTTTKIPITYERFITLDAVGMRTHPQWVYVVDPANANLRRYKFIKIADVSFPAWYDGMPDGDVEELEHVGDPDDLHNCDQCCPDKWYVGESQYLFCGGSTATNKCCPGAIAGTSADPASCLLGEEKYLFAPKSAQNASCGGSTATTQYEACTTTASDDGEENWGHYDNYGPYCSDTNPDPSVGEEAPTSNTSTSPYARLPVFLTNDMLDAATDRDGDGKADIDITYKFSGISFDNSAGFIFVLNGAANGEEEPGKGCECEKINAFPSTAAEKSWNVPANPSCEEDILNGGGCKSDYQVEFTYVPVDCAEEFDDENSMMYVDVYPCGHAGAVMELPKFKPMDYAFQIPVPGVDTSDGISAAEQTIIDNRWANLTAYMDLVPPRSYPGYSEYTSPTLGTIGYGYTTNTSFTSADYVRFRNPRDVDAYRDYFDVSNGAPAYIFVADTMNSRIQVFMNATGSAGEPNASFPIRPVPVAKRAGIWSDSSLTEYQSNELAMRIHTGINNTAVAFGHGRKADWRNYTTVTGDGVSSTDHTLDDKSRIPATAGRGEFYYPHGVAVDQDPDTKDVYLFVADTFNHRIQIFRDTTGVSNQAITDKHFDFKYEEGWGTYPLQTSNNPEFVTLPGPFHFRYPKGVDVVRFKNNSSYLYVVDSKNYRLMKYKIGENPAGGISSVEAVNAYGYNGTKFDASLFTQQGVPMTASSTNPGFLNPQDVATGYSGFYIFTSPAGKGTQFLNDYMVYVSDYARNNTSISRDYLNMRVQQFIQVPTFGNLSGSWIPWDTEAVEFGSWTSNNLALGQSVYGLSDGFYNSSSLITGNIVEGSTENVPGKPGYFTDRPVGLATLQWNTKKLVDIRVVGPANSPTTAYVNGDTISRSTEIRIGASSRYLFLPPENDVDAFLNSSTEVSEVARRWDGLYAGRVHVFCYDQYGQFDNHTALHTAPYRIQLSTMNPTCKSKGFVKIVAEDRDFAYSGRTGTMFFRIGN